ncbi:MAG TPA: glycosyltransferase family 2 protein, partial [Isosphaeraceae bacterium]|nr:glycosyltransferase family 2 protein [Isosphaeraceae bacterium]
VIPTYNGRHRLEICLASLERCRPDDLDLEIVVADDASTNGSAEWLAEAYPHVRVVRLTQNGGFVAAANAGIAAASGSVIQVLNNDTEVTPGWAEAGLAPFADSTVGSVAPLVLVRSDPSRVDSAGDRFAVFGWPSKRGHGQDAETWKAHRPGPVFGASGSSAFYRAKALETVGAYDPAFGSYYEDVDLAFRLRWAGYSCVFEPSCRILHEVSASYDHTRPDLQRRMSRNAELLFWTDLPAAWLIAALVPHLGFTCLQGLWRFARGRARPFLAGKLDAVRMLPGFLVRRRERTRLRRSAIAPPHFPLTVGSLADVRNHLTRPKEASSRAS